MKLTVKGQVTVPIAVRRQLGLKPGSEVEFVARDGIAELRPVHKAKPSQPLPDWIVKMTGTATSGMSTDELMRLTRGED